MFMVLTNIRRLNKNRTSKDVHATDNVGDGFGNAVVAGGRVTLAAFVQQLDKLGREPASQAVKLTDPAVIVFLWYDLQPEQHSTDTLASESVTTATALRSTSYYRTSNFLPTCSSLRNPIHGYSFFTGTQVQQPCNLF